jgi:hypothetical protein
VAVDRGCYKMTNFRLLNGSKYPLSTGVHEWSPSMCSPGRLLLDVLCCGLGGWKAAKGMPLVEERML